MDELLFKVCERNEKGKKVRRNGEIPCVIYGDEVCGAISAKMTKREMYRLLGYPKSSVISLDINGHIKKCIVKELQRDIYGHIAHIDFNCIRKGESVKLTMPVTYNGEEALEARGLRLEVLVPEIELQGDPTKFPKHIELDISKFELDRQIFLSELPISSDVISEGNENLEIAKIVNNYHE